LATQRARESFVRMKATYRQRIMIIIITALLVVNTAAIVWAEMQYVP